MNRYLLLAAAAASVAVTGPLPDLQWQNNNGLVDFIPESPSALEQDARGLNVPVLDRPWMIAEDSYVKPVSDKNEVKGMDLEKLGFDPANGIIFTKVDNDEDRSPPNYPSIEPPFMIFGRPPTDIWRLRTFECKAQASVCCSQENRLGPDFLQTPSSTKSCAASMFHPNIFCHLSKLSCNIFCTGSNGLITFCCCGC